MPLLWKAMHRIDPDTNEPRGYMVLKNKYGGPMCALVSPKCFSMLFCSVSSLLLVAVRHFFPGRTTVVTVYALYPAYHDKVLCH